MTACAGDTPDSLAAQKQHLRRQLRAGRRALTPRQRRWAAQRCTVKTLALIDEAVCIGCTKCIQACPVDAIVGAANQMHTVIESHCTGCELCLPPCPVDCITMEPVADTVKTWRWPQPQQPQREQEAA